MGGTDQVNQAYAEGIDAGRLLIQQCLDCQRCQFYPRITCSHCAGDRLDWTESRGGGVVVSFTVVRRGVSADFIAPYVVALVELDEGVRMMTHIVGPDPEQVQIGTPVVLTFQPVGAAGRLPVFSPSPLQQREASP